MPPRPIKGIETLEALEPFLTDDEALSLGIIRGAACNHPFVTAHGGPRTARVAAVVVVGPVLPHRLHLGVSENLKGESSSWSPRPLFDVACHVRVARMVALRHCLPSRRTIRCSTTHHDTTNSGIDRLCARADAHDNDGWWLEGAADVASARWRRRRDVTISELFMRA